ncbi:TonB-dependent receptor SusC precursor [mine drainage metagenome]|uniref:TonB-dependent receptor SusC n=1 Tax=mine drainage metagenome TaxID=410659 RepID=A0A1J5S4F3_9ZZZZ
MKKTKTGSALKTSGILKVLLLMKLTIAILLVSLVQVSAKGFSQSKVTLKLSNVELKKVLYTIEKKSNCRFLYNDDAISLTNPKVDVNVDKALVTDVLNTIFAGTNLVYKVLGNNLIVLSAKDNLIQDIKITGRVMGSNGDPVPSATVRVKGTTVVTSADVNGYFTIIAPDNATLVISSVGFNQTEISVSGRKEVNVTLKESEKVLDQVVVIGYGTANKRDLTGSIVKIAGKEVADKPNTNPVASLQSKVAGLYVVNNGTPGQAPDIRIRGTVSIGQVHPLYVVDGIFNDNIDYLNPNDIESIEVLKDPSSLAIFGVKGATGVIAITTKKAKAGQTIINFNTSYGFKKLVDKIQMANASQFNTLFAEENANNNVTTPDYSALTANTDWIDAVTRTGNFSNSNLSVSGATERNKFNFGVGYLSDDGIIRHENLKKITLSLSDEFKATKGIKLGFTFNTAKTDNPYGASWVLDAARKVMPQVSALTKTFKVQNPYGTDSMNVPIYSGLDAGLQNSGVVNPLLVLENEWDKTKSTEYRYVGSAYVDINLLKYFNFRATWYADISSVNTRVYAPLYYFYNPLNNTPTLYRQQTSLQENNSAWRKFQQDYILTFKRQLGSHSITATGGFTTYYKGNFNTQVLAKQGTSASDLAIPNDPRFWYIGSGPWGIVDPTNTYSSQSEATTVSALGRVLYNYKSKYFLTASIRNDASSLMLPQNRNQMFWAIGGGWEISKENFMQNQKFFDFLKLKASTGVLGNQSAVDGNGNTFPYPAYPGVTLGSGTSSPFGSYLYSAVTPAYIASPNLKWETVNSAEVGIEFSAFNNRLHVEANYYNKLTNNLMTYVDRAPLGLKPELINGGSIKNWGEEFAASWNQKVNKDFSVSVAGNITFMKNRVESLAPDLQGLGNFLSRAFFNNGSGEARTIVGQPIGSFYGYKVDGLYQSYADILASPVASAVGSYRPGDFKFHDVNGDGVIGPNDRTVIGNPSPKFTYGGSVNLTYKQFSLGVDFGGVYGNMIFRGWGSLESPFQRVNYAAFKMNRWHGAGTSNWEPILSQADRFNYNGSTYNIEDGSYFRIRNLQLGYTFDQKLLSKAKITGLRVFANVQNLKTWKHNTGYTPEFGGDATAFGFDFGGGAIPMVTTMGLNVTF